MKKIAAVLLLAGCCGCSAGVHTGLVEFEMRLASPMLGGDNKGVPVVYPAVAGGRGKDDSMVQAFGPSWKSVEGDYPAYNFNP
jgi:hypothetical protein